MVQKIKKLPILLLLSIVSVGLWALVTFDDFMNINTRTPLTTTTIDPEQPVRTQDGQNTVSQPALPVASPQITPATPPAPEKRIPGTNLSQEILDDLGIEEPLEEEQLFFTTATTPNDPIYPQWYTTIIDAPNAWDTTTGGSETIVAVIDTGFALDHEDLADAWHINTGEQGTTSNGDACWTGTPQDKQTNNCDDDANGFDDDWRGWDFAGNDNNPQTATNSVVGSSHGTKSAGLVAGRGNNAVGTASVNWGAKIIPIQALFDEGYGYTSDITGAIYYAVEMGADVINLSLGGPSPDSFTLAAVQYAQQNNVIVIASSGNCGDTQSTPECTGYPSPGGMGYPARYTEVIAVGATTSTDAQASFSSWGDELTVVAPGSGSIRTPTWLSTNETSAYSSTSFGTSFSSPIAAGAIALVKDQMPSITSDEVVALLANSSDKVSGMNGEDWTNRFGWGRLNVHALLAELSVYQAQLQKGAGQIAQQTTTTPPQATTNTGHTSNTAITNSTTARTSCVTTPDTLCTITIQRSSGGSYTIGTRHTNAQGITTFTWSRDNRPTGNYSLTATANGSNSSAESIILE